MQPNLRQQKNVLGRSIEAKQLEISEMKKNGVPWKFIAYERRSVERMLRVQRKLKDQIEELGGVSSNLTTSVNPSNVSAIDCNVEILA